MVRHGHRLPKDLVDGPIPGSVLSQAGQGFQQSSLVGSIPAHGRGVGTRWSLRVLPTQTILYLSNYKAIIVS